MTANTAGSATYAYDALGRRASVTVNGTTSTYLYDGLNAATAPGSLLLASGNLDEIFASVSSSGATSFLRDGLNSSAALTSSSGTISGNYYYSPYGDSGHTGTSTSTFEYTGRENDGATGLYYYRARYYSPQFGRFISEDPSGLGGGTNFYTYADGSPVLLSDPRGLSATANAITGFGDGVYRIVTLGTGDLNQVRDFIGLGNEVSLCSDAYRRGKYFGWAWGIGLFWAAGLNGGASSVFWQGAEYNARGAAQLIGTTVDQTPIGGALASLESGLGVNFPSFVWAPLSWTFAMNASGTATAVILGEGAAPSIWSSIELPILMARGIPVVTMP